MTTVEIRLQCHDFVCDWGAFTNPDGNPAKPISHLMIITSSNLRDLLTKGPIIDKYGYRISATNLDSGIYFTAQLGVQRWTWQLFPARFWDEPEPEAAAAATLFVGRWPD